MLWVPEDVWGHASFHLGISTQNHRAESGSLGHQLPKTLGSILLDTQSNPLLRHFTQAHHVQGHSQMHTNPNSSWGHGLLSSFSVHPRYTVTMGHA